MIMNLHSRPIFCECYNVQQQEQVWSFLEQAQSHRPCKCAPRNRQRKSQRAGRERAVTWRSPASARPPSATKQKPKQGRPTCSVQSSCRQGWRRDIWWRTKEVRGGCTSFWVWKWMLDRNGSCVPVGSRRGGGEVGSWGRRRWNAISDHRRSFWRMEKERENGGKKNYELWWVGFSGQVQFSLHLCCLDLADECQLFPKRWSRPPWFCGARGLRRHAWAKKGNDLLVVWFSVVSIEQLISPGKVWLRKKFSEPSVWKWTFDFLAWKKCDFGLILFCVLNYLFIDLRNKY